MLVVFCVFFVTSSFAHEKEDDRLKESYAVLKEILATPDKGIPRDLLAKAECVVVYPSVKKAAFIVGASYGRGVITCRSGQDFRGPWSAPAMFALEGGSFGLQIGGEATDFVLLIMNEEGAERCLAGSGLRPAFSWKAIALIELSAKPGAVHGDDCRRHAQTGIGKELSVS